MSLGSKQPKRTPRLGCSMPMLKGISGLIQEPCDAVKLVLEAAKLLHVRPGSPASLRLSNHRCPQLSQTSKACRRGTWHKALLCRLRLLAIFCCKDSRRRPSTAVQPEAEADGMQHHLSCPACLANLPCKLALQVLQCACGGAARTQSGAARSYGAAHGLKHHSFCTQPLPSSHLLPATSSQPLPSSCFLPAASFKALCCSHFLSDLGCKSQPQVDCGHAEGQQGKGVESRSLMVMDMGQHVLQDCPQPLTLHQVMVPGLEDRSQTFPALVTARQLSPGLHSLLSPLRVVQALLTLTRSRFTD